MKIDGAKVINRILSNTQNVLHDALSHPPFTSGVVAGARHSGPDPPLCLQRCYAVADEQAFPVLLFFVRRPSQMFFPLVWSIRKPRKGWPDWLLARSTTAQQPAFRFDFCSVPVLFSSKSKSFFIEQLCHFFR